MIAGELEYLHGQTGNEDYDYFFKKLFEKKGNRKTTEEKTARKEKRKAFWSKIGSGITGTGESEGLLGSVGNVMSLLKPKEQQGNFEVGIGHNVENTTNKGLPKEIVIIGGIVVLGVAAWGFSQYQKNQALKLETKSI